MLTGQRRWWRGAIWLLAVVGLAQACGGDQGRGTGPSGAAQAVVTFQGVQRAQLPQNCTGELTVTGPGMADITVPIPPDGRVVVIVPAGPQRTFEISLTCQKTTGPGSFTGSQTVDVVAGQPLSLSITVTVNEAPQSAAVSCASPVIVNAGSSCSCRAVDPDPADVLQYSWSATGGSLSTTSGPSTVFSSSSPGAFDVTCAVSDGRTARRTTADVTVLPVPTASLSVTILIISLGPGSVTSNPPGIACTTGPLGPGTCSASFPIGSTVTLTAAGTLDPPGWGGACAAFGLAPVCTLTITGPTSVTATFF